MSKRLIKKKTTASFSEWEDGYLRGTPIDPQTSKRYLKLIKDLDEAKREAIRIKCGGITKVNNGYKLRQGKDVLQSPKEEQSIILK